MNHTSTTNKTSRAITALLVFEASLNTAGTEKRVPQSRTFETVWNGKSISYSLGWLIDMIENN